MKPWLMTVDEQMGRIPKSKEYKWEKEIREYCSLEKHQVGCLIGLLIRLKRVPQQERIRWTRWWCVKNNECKHYKGSRETPERVSTERVPTERMRISDMPTRKTRKPMAISKSSPHPEVEELFRQEVSTSDIAKKTRLSPSQIRYCLKRVGLI